MTGINTPHQPQRVKDNQQGPAKRDAPEMPRQLDVPMLVLYSILAVALAVGDGIVVAAEYSPPADRAIVEDLVTFTIVVHAAILFAALALLEPGTRPHRVVWLYGWILFGANLAGGIDTLQPGLSVVGVVLGALTVRYGGFRWYPHKEDDRRDDT